MLMPRQLAVPALGLLYVACVVTSNVGFKLSAESHNWRGFLAWQVVGNFAGFLGVISFTLLLKFIPLYLAYGIFMGLGFLAVQVVAARLIFKEPIRSVQWIGVTLILVGIFLIALGRKE